MVPSMDILAPSQPELGLGQTMEYNCDRCLPYDDDNDVDILHHVEFRGGWFREGYPVGAQPADYLPSGEPSRYFHHLPA